MNVTWNQRAIKTLSFKGREIRITWNLIMIAAALIVSVLFPFLNLARWTTFAMTMFMFIALICSWNIITGFTGYFSFGHVVFFGIGAYAGAIAMVDLGMIDIWPLAAILAGFFAMGFAALIAYPLLRLRGPYFSICTLGISTVMMILFQSRELEWLTRGGWGFSLPLYRDNAALYYAMFFSAIAAFLFMYKIRNSKLGNGLIAIREDEDVAQFMGINTTRLKITALILSSFFIGVTGAVWALYVSYIDAASVYSLKVNFEMITMAMFGGLGTIWGPIIGAFSLGPIAEYLWAVYPEIHLVILGGLIVVIVIAAPEGLMGLKNSTRFRPVLEFLELVPPAEESVAELSDVESSIVEESSATTAESSQPEVGEDGG